MRPVIAKGTCFPMFAYEVAQAIDLDAAQRRLFEGVERQTIKYKRRAPASLDRKSTRLNSSHTVISYAVFCFKKKNSPEQLSRQQQLQSKPLHPPCISYLVLLPHGSL